MPFADGLRHTCTIQRSTPAQDTAGQPIDSWAALHTGLACRLIIKAERVAVPGEGLMMLTTYKLLLPANTDVRTDDRVSVVMLEDAGTVGPLDIQAVLPRRGNVAQHHIALLLELVD